LSSASEEEPQERKKNDVKQWKRTMEIYISPPQTFLVLLVLPAADTICGSGYGSQIVVWEILKESKAAAEEEEEKESRLLSRRAAELPLQRHKREDRNSVSMMMEIE